MKSTVPTGTIEVSAHIQIAIDKERRGSPTITNLKPHPLSHWFRQKKKKKKISYPECTAAGTIWDPGGGEIDKKKKCFVLCNCQRSHLFLSGDHPTAMHAINIARHAGKFSFVEL